MLFAMPVAVYSQSDGIDQVRQEYLAATSARDAARVAGLFAGDALLVAPDGTLVHGREQIAKYFSESFAQNDAADVAFQSQTAESENGFGSETGRFEERMTGAAGGYVLIYRQDGEGLWRIAIEIRSQAPRPAAAQ
jgi:ketosteroid isomerase-like protein